MAIVIPYGDPNAHGTIGGSLTFRRRFGRVVLEKTPVPKYTNTPAQQVQRDAFKNASDLWYSYPYDSKAYFDTRGKELHMTGKNLFISAQLKSIMPLLTPPAFVKILQCQIISVIESTPSTAYITLEAHDPGSPFMSQMGTIYDNSNSFTPGVTLTNNCDQMRISFHNYTADLFRYGFWLQYERLDTTLGELIVRTNSTQNIFSSHYVSADGSLFKDQTFDTLLATNNF